MPGDGLKRPGALRGPLGANPPASDEAAQPLMGTAHDSAARDVLAPPAARTAPDGPAKGVDLRPPAFRGAPETLRVWGPEVALEATRSMSPIHGSRAFELMVARCLALPGTEKLDQIDMQNLRAAVRDELARAPARVPAAGLTPVLTARQDAAKRATQRRLAVLAEGAPELHAKLRVIMQAVADAQVKLAEAMPNLLGSDHPLHAAVVQIPRAARPQILMPLLESCLRTVHASMPLVSCDMQTVTRAFAGGAFAATCEPQVRAFVEGLKPSVLRTGLANLYAEQGEHFVTRYSQGADPQFRWPGNGGVCHGLCLYWIQAGGRLRLEAPGTVGPNAARRVHPMQTALTLSKAIVDVPGFRERSAKVREAVAEGTLADHWATPAQGASFSLKEELGRAKKEQAQRAAQERWHTGRALDQASQRLGRAAPGPELKALLAKHRGIDHAMPYRMIMQAHPVDIKMVPRLPTQVEPHAWFQSLQKATDVSVAQALRQTRQTGQVTKMVVLLQLSPARGHAVALSIGPTSASDRTPRLTFFDPNAGEAVFYARPSWQPLRSLADFEHFAAFSESWFEKVYDGTALAVHLENFAL